MQWKRLRHLLSWQRWRRCRQLFRSPTAAFLAVSFVSKRPFQLRLKSGGSLTFSRAARDHHIWDWLLGANANIPVRFVEGDCVAVEFARQTLALRPATLDTFVLREVFLDDVYGLRNIPGRLGTVLDLGANAGLFSCAVLPRADRVIAVEAVSENYRHACRNILQNGGRVSDVLQFALAGASGQQARILLDPGHSGGHSLYTDVRASSLGARFESVETISLSDLLDRTGCGHVDFLKCDIEGAEYDVFLHTPREVLRKVGCIAMEAHLFPSRPPEALRALISHLVSAGFEVELDRPLPTTADRPQCVMLRAIGPKSSISAANWPYRFTRPTSRAHAA